MTKTLRSLKVVVALEVAVVVRAKGAVEVAVTVDAVAKIAAADVIEVETEIEP